MKTPNLTPMRSMRASLNEIWEEPLIKILQDVRDYENNGHAVTWPRNTGERRASRDTMGIQLASDRPPSPITLD